MMKLSLYHHPLRIPALLLLGALIIGTGLLLWSLDHHSAGEADMVSASTREAVAARAARQAPEMLRRSQEEAGLYEEQRVHGFLGPEQRERWITALGRARAVLKLESLSWRLAPRSSSPIAAGLRVSAMDISVSRVDAEQLDALFKLLHDGAPGRFTLERCELALNPDGVSGQAQCRLNWWTWEEDASPQR